MSSRKVQINDLRLRVPGLSREQARTLGESVARHLAEVAPGIKRSVKMPTISIRIDQPANRSIEPLAREIANRIRTRLG